MNKKIFSIFTLLLFLFSTTLVIGKDNEQYNHSIIKKNISKQSIKYDNLNSIKTNNKKYRSNGIASWYNKSFHGKKTSSGMIYDEHCYTAASRDLPLFSVVKVINKNNGETVKVLVNDRGPYAGKNRIIDLSRRAANKLKILSKGLTKVEVIYDEEATKQLLASNDKYANYCGDQNS